MSKLRALSLQLSDVVAQSYQKLGIPLATLNPATSNGIVLPCAQPKFGDFQCNLSMNIHKQHFSPVLKELQQATQPAAAPAEKASGEAKEGTKSKKEKKKGSSPGFVTVDTLPALPNVNIADVSTIPKTPQELSLHVLNDLYTNTEVSTATPKRPSSPLLAAATVAPTGFLNLSLSPEYLSQRVMHTVYHNDAAAPLILEQDIPLLTQTATHYTPTSTTLPAYPRVMTIDYSSPNIAKEMHVGHIRSTVIGDSISKLAEFAGFVVHRANHVGDWGTQFGMLIEYFSELRRGMHGGMNGEMKISDLQTFYRAAKVRFDEDQEFHDRAKENVVKLQSGDPECRALWKQLCDFSSIEFRKIYERLQIDPRLLERGESYYNPFLADVVEELVAKGIAVESGGAIVVLPRVNVNESAVEGDGEGDAAKKNENKTENRKEEKDEEKEEDLEVAEAEAEAEAEGHVGNAVVLRKSGGGYTYGATDMAALRLRLLGPRFYNEANKPVDFDAGAYDGGMCEGNDWALYVVDSGQGTHFERVMEAGADAGWVELAKERAKARAVAFATEVRAVASDLGVEGVGEGEGAGEGVRVEHVNFGVVLGANGKRLRTRAGQQIKLADLLDESVSSARQMLLEHQAEMSDDVVDAVSACVGYSAIKYGDLKRNRVNDYIFSFEAMLDLKGDTAVYSMYAHARMFKVLQRATAHPRYADAVAAWLPVAHGDTPNGGKDNHGAYPSLFAHALAEGATGSRLVAAAIAQYATDTAKSMSPVHYNAQTKQTERTRAYVEDLVRSITQDTATLPPLQLSHPSEQALVLHLSKFQDAVVGAAAALQMNVLTAYTNELATKFAAFYRDCSVLSVEEPENTPDCLGIQDSRVLLVHASAVTLRRCFNLIGVDAIKQL